MLNNNNLKKYISEISSTNDEKVLLEKISLYKEMIIEENKKINLISKTTIEDIENRHLLDSVQILPLITPRDSSLLDIGTGAGLPGIMLAIAGCTNVNLVEKQTKKCVFLKKVNKALDLKMVILNKRIESIVEPKFDFIVSRAFAKINEIINLTKNVSHKNTKYIFLKGKTFLSETKSVNKKIFNINYFNSITSLESKIVELRLK